MTPGRRRCRTCVARRASRRRALWGDVSYPRDIKLRTWRRFSRSRFRPYFSAPTFYDPYFCAPAFPLPLLPIPTFFDPYCSLASPNAKTNTKRANISRNRRQSNRRRKTKPPKNQKRNGGTESTDKLKKCETRNDESDAGAKPVPLTRSHRLSGESVRGNGLNFIALKISTTLGTFRNYYGLRFLAGLDVRAWELRGKAEIPPGSPTPY